MPDILLPVAVSQGQTMSRRAQDSDETPDGTSKGGNVGFNQLLEALGIDLTQIQGVDLEGQPVFPQGESQGIAIDLATMMNGQDPESGTVDGSSQLPPEIAHLIDSNDFESLLQDLYAFLQQQGLAGGPALPQAQLPPDTDDPDALSVEGVEPDLPPDADQLPVAPVTVQDEGRMASQTSVPDEWVAQLPANLQPVLARLLAAGNGLPQPAVTAQGAVAEIAAQSPPLQQMLAMLQQGSGNESASDTPMEEVLAQALAGKSRSGKSPVGGVTADLESAGKGKNAELRLSAVAAAGLADAEAVSLDEQLPLRSSVLNMQQALGQSSPGTSWAAPLTSASGLALQAGAPAGGPSSVLLSSPQAPAILTPPGDAAWSQALGERVLWMTGRNMQQAEIRLSPPQLGPVEIRVSVQNDQATVSFTAQHPFTREALEASLPRLREMLGEANLNLADVDVGQRDAGESRADRWGEAGQGAGDGQALADGEAELEAGAVSVTRVSNGLVDDFA